MTFSDRYYADRDKMKECMFGMPIEKEELAYYSITYTYAPATDIVWAAVEENDMVEHE